MATPDWRSLFIGWSGDCSGSDNPCSVGAVTVGKSATATFMPNIQCINADSDVGYAALQDAYDAAASGATIKARSYVFYENLVLDAAKNIIIDGGKDSSYLSTIGQTTVHGTITVKLGKATIGYLEIH